MPTVRLPSPLRLVAGGQAHVAVHGSDIRAVLASLVSAHPRLRDRLLTPEGDLQGFVNVFVDDRDIRRCRGLDTPVGPADVVTIVPAVAGGAGQGPGDRHHLPPGLARFRGGRPSAGRGGRRRRW